MSATGGGQKMKQLLVGAFPGEPEAAQPAHGSARTVSSSEYGGEQQHSSAADPARVRQLVPTPGGMTMQSPAHDVALVVGHAHATAARRDR